MKYVSVAALALVPSALADKYYTQFTYSDSTCETVSSISTLDAEVNFGETDCSGFTYDCTDLANGTYSSSACGASLTGEMGDAYYLQYTDTTCSTATVANAILNFGTCGAYADAAGTYQTAECDATDTYLMSYLCTDDTCDTSSTCTANMGVPLACTAIDASSSYMAVGCSSTGSCYSSTSTATRLASDGRGHEDVPLSELRVGHRILSLDEHAKPSFAAIEALPHGPAKEAYVRIVMAGKSSELQATLHHSFPACVSHRHPTGGTLMAKDVKAGDCLHTAAGKSTVHKATRVEPQAGDVTYSIKMAGNVDTIAIGGVFTHAMGAAKAAHAKANDAKKSHVDKMVDLMRAPFKYHHAPRTMGTHAKKDGRSNKN